MGEAASADMSTVPDLAFLDDPAWGWRATLYPVKSRYQFIIENLMDLTHLAFVHTTTIGNSAVIDQADVTTIRGVSDVQVDRWMINSDPPPTYAKIGDFKGQRVDRWQLLRYTTPSIIRLWTGAAPHGRNARENITQYGAPDGGKLGGVGFINVNLITPQTPTSTHYFWAQGQDLKPGDQTMTDMVFEQADTAFKQDWALFEQQQIRTDQKPDAPRMSVHADVAGAHSINMLNSAIEAEQSGSRAS
jgi:phenylpropionate dioxygenase-like ring-hydroxylating dioxygenase large terminal subunit